MADEVRCLLLARAALLSRQVADRDPSLNYWDRVTLAESELLLGLLSAARHSYREAFEQHPELKSSIDVTIAQVGTILPALGLSCSAQDFLRPARWDR